MPFNEPIKSANRHSSILKKMIPPLEEIKSLLCEGREHAFAQLRSYSVQDVQAILEESIALFSQTANNSRVEDEPLLDILAQLAFESASIFGLDKSATILTDYSFYHEQLGNFRKGIKFGMIALELAETHGDINLQRRAHSVLGAHFVGICDFQMACHHLEVALRFARKLDNPLFECAVLSNISILFSGMGLHRDSTRVALKALSYPDNTLPLQSLQALNAVNILKMSRLINDSRTRDYSYRMASVRIKRKHLEANKLLIAYFEFSRALYLIDCGKRDIASRHIDRALVQHGLTNNPRVDALLLTAKALCAFVSADPLQTRKAKQALKRLLHTTIEFPTHHEDVLRALVQVYGAEKTLRGRKVSLSYAQQLRQYVLEEKKVDFSLQIDEDSNGGNISNSLHLKLDHLALRKRSVEAERPSPPLDRKNAKPLDVEREFSAIYDDLAKLRESVTEERFRTGAYAIAENWALAAEFSTDSSGRHCFRVGKLARAIALNLFMKAEECVEVELACRLHDIGKIAINEITFQRPELYPSEDYKSVKEHTIAGARLLSCSRDPILIIAADVAKYHHEWWNGCGYPEGLRGEVIPLGARICAIADTYDTLTNPQDDRVTWTHTEAVQQICAMAGVQLDPNLILPFLEAMKGDAAATERVAEEVDRSMERNQLAQAKKKLFEALELVY